MSVQSDPAVVFGREIAALMPMPEEIINIIGRAIADSMPDPDDILDAIESGAYRALAEHLRAG